MSRRNRVEGNVDPRHAEALRELRDGLGEHDWRELTTYVRELVRRVHDAGLVHLSPDSDGEAQLERWCAREARRSIVALHHLTSFADDLGGLFEVRSLDDPEAIPTEIVRGIVDLVVEHFRSGGTVDLTRAQEESLVLAVAVHVVVTADPLGSVVVVVPDEVDSAQGPSTGLLGVTAPGKEWLGAYQLFLPTRDAILASVRADRRIAERFRAPTQSGDLSYRRWNDVAVTELVMPGMPQRLAFVWHAEVSAPTARSHVVRSLAMLSGLARLSGARSMRRRCRVVVVGESEEFAESQEEGWEEFDPTAPPPVAEFEVVCSIPHLLDATGADPWWQSAGRHFAYDIHEYATEADKAEGRFRRALHFWCRAEGLTGSLEGSTYDVADRFLDYLTAIEVAVGTDRKRVTQSLIQRVVVASATLDSNATAKLVRDLYDVRSRYVHDGLPHVGRDDLKHARELARLVLRHLASWSVEHAPEGAHAEYVRHCDPLAHPE